MMQFRQNSDDILKIHRIYNTKTIITFKFDWQFQTSWNEEKKLFLLFSPKKKTRFLSHKLEARLKRPK